MSRLPFAACLAVASALPNARAAEPDVDGDGYSASFDCDDTDASVNPDAREICNGIDDDCDGLVDDDDDGLSGPHHYWFDADGDGVGSGRSVLYCGTAPSGYVQSSGDCDDTDPTVSSWTSSFLDSDGDGYGYWQSTVTCGIPSGYVSNGSDCDDTDASIHPDAPEICNKIDDDCDSRVDLDDSNLIGIPVYEDADRDGYGDDATKDTTGCAVPHGSVGTGGDCDDTNVATHPAAPEICDAEDNDCDGAVDDATVNVDWYRDHDGDGYGVSTDIVRACVPPPHYARGRGDCDDSSFAVAPDRDEICGNGIDDDCDGARDNCSLAADEVADVVLRSSEESLLGYAIAAGDIDADGTADLLVAAPWAGDFGRIYAFHGPLTGSVSDEDAVLTISGTWPGGAPYFGGAFKYQDANGDGYDDLVVSAPLSGTPQAYLFLGPVTADTTSADADATFWNDGYGTAFGTSVAVLGDHDGDGIPDLAFGTPGTDLKDGGVAVISGDSVGEHNVRADGSYNYRSRQHDRCGQSLATLDDNGDGIADLLAGAPMGSAAYLVDGGMPLGAHNLVETADATFRGDWVGAWFGESLAAGDLNGDGYADVIVGAPLAITSARDAAGGVYAFMGPLSGTYEARDADSRWIGDADQTGSFGWSIATGADIDGDTEPDLLISDPYRREDEGGTVFVQFGTPAGIISSGELTALHSSEWDWLGYAVGFVPDWDGDGLPEVAAGAPLATDDTGAVTGRASVFFSDSLFE